jgi:hypothetical protein
MRMGEPPPPPTHCQTQVLVFHWSYPLPQYGGLPTGLGHELPPLGAVHTPLEQVSPEMQQSAAVPHDSPVKEQAPQVPLERQMAPLVQQSEAVLHACPEFEQVPHAPLERQISPGQQGSLLAHVEPDAMQQPESLTACGYVPEHATPLHVAGVDPHE